MKKLKLHELNRLSDEEFKAAKKTELILVLDNIRSMHNVGSIFRTSDAFLAKEIYLCGITAQPPHRDITKTAIGAQNTVNWYYNENAINVVKELISQGYQLIALEQTSNSVLMQDFDWPVKTALILGNEVDGVSDEVLALCHTAVEIPQLGTKHSLNVSVSAGMSIWEYAKQHSI
jgi:23S rRNA (guanosine2251-2'-O)-methyltransferase